MDMDIPSYISIHKICCISGSGQSVVSRAKQSQGKGTLKFDSKSTCLHIVSEEPCHPSHTLLSSSLTHISPFLPLTHTHTHA